VRELPAVAVIGVHRHKERELLEDKRLGEEQCTATKKKRLGEVAFFGGSRFVKNRCLNCEHQITSQFSCISSYRQGEIASPEGFFVPNLVSYCSHREPRIPEDYPLQPVRPIHAFVHNRIRYTLSAEAARGLCVADRRDPLPPVVALSAAVHPAQGSARLARLPGNGRAPLPTPA